MDLHRDATPPDEYQAKVEGQEVTKIKLVVGRQNPNMKTNLEFAKKIKAVMDEKKEGLSNGIFLGKGDYNQDLNPRAVLLEVGSHTNKKDEAQNGVELFAETIPVVLGVDNTSGATDEPAAKPMTTDNQGALNSIVFLVVVLAAAAGGFYLLNRKSANK
jgi:stage II sporulation protein P